MKRLKVIQHLKSLRPGKYRVNENIYLIQQEREENEINHYASHIRSKSSLICVPLLFPRVRHILITIPLSNSHYIKAFTFNVCKTFQNLRRSTKNWSSNFQLLHTNKGGDWFIYWRHSNRHAQAQHRGAICVQRFDDSRNSAIHMTYRSLLRSSSN